MNDLIYIICTNLWLVVISISITSNVNVFDHKTNQLKRHWIIVGLEFTLAAPQTILGQLLWGEFILVLCFLFNKKSQISFNAVKLNPYAFSLAISNSWSRQSKTIERSVRNAPKDLPLSTYLFHFSSIANRQCWVLKPLLQSHWYFDNIASKNVISV